MNMKITSKMMVALLALGMTVAGTVSFADPIGNQNFWQNMNSRGSQNAGYNMMGNSIGNNFNSGYGHMGGMMGGYTNNESFGNGFGHMNGMFGSNGWNNTQDFDDTKLKSIDELKENVEKYLENFDGTFEIDDIFVYSNSDYYFSVAEAESGRGAMELLVNPVSGYVYPEFGPNMMWNTEYGMHGSNGFGGMMGGFFNNYNEADAITADEALEKANAYLEQLDTSLTTEEGGHAFYGYYTFHLSDGDTMKGMLSVNAYTGDVWYHNWHGNLIEVIEDDHE